MGRWVGKYFPTRGTYETVFERSGGTRVSRPHRTLVKTFEAQVVCGTCNSGWMNREIESVQHGPLAKMIDRTRLETAPKLRVSLGEQRRLALWATKVGLLWPYTLPDPYMSDPRQLRALRRDLRPPRGTYVWIGAYSMAETYYRFFRLNITARGPLRLKEPRTVAMNTSVFVLGHVAFRLFQGPFHSPYPSSRSDPTDGPWVRIWPASRRILIWPTPVMGMGSIAAFAASIPTP